MNSDPDDDVTSNEEIGDLDLSNLIDAQTLQSLMDDFYALAHVPMSVIDLQGRVLVGVGWQQVCLNFHRVHPVTFQHCLESDLLLTQDVPAGECKLYKCKNNMWDIATPIVMDGRQVGNVFSGQFFFDDELPDYELFRAQARQYGFNEAAYLAALDQAPRLSRDTLNRAMAFFVKLAQMISRLGYSNLQLARSNRELETFAYIASHDLNEPLRKIEMFGSRLADATDQLDEKQQDYLQRMIGAARRMREMVDGLLTLSRVTTQGQPFEPVDLEKVLEGVLSDLEMQLRRTQGGVERCSLQIIQADPLQIRQLLQNLIGNALKYHRPGIPPIIKITCQALLPDSIQILVEDNGIGFEESQSERIFQPFQRLVGRGEFEGSGMGLAICRKIVERHCGKISVHSLPGKGSTFIVTLPVNPPC